MEHPGFQCLLADMDAGKVDVIVVYKIGRLSRSLLDFMKIIERFNQKGVSFVSVTRHFNTTDPTQVARLDGVRKPLIDGLAVIEVQEILAHAHPGSSLVRSHPLYDLVGYVRHWTTPLAEFYS